MRTRRTILSAPKAARAFSLIEVLIAIFVLGVALAGLTQGIAVALQSSKESEQQTAAAPYAAGLVETLRAEGDLSDGETEGTCGEGLPNYRWHQTVAKSDLDGLHDVTVTIESAKDGKTIYELRTMLFEAPDDLSVSA